MSEHILLTKAKTEEFPEVLQFYHSLIDALEGAEYHPKWRKGIYPAGEDLRAAIEEGTLFIGRCGDRIDECGEQNAECNDRIAGAMVVNERYSEEYRQAAWPAELTVGEYLVIHLLGVHSDFKGRGFAKQLVQYAIDVAHKTGKKALRLDVIKGNLPAVRLYESFGFGYVETVPVFYEEYGRMEFELYELVL